MYMEVLLEMVSYIGYLSVRLIGIGLLFGAVLLLDEVLRMRRGGVK